MKKATSLEIQNFLVHGTNMKLVTSANYSMEENLNNENNW
jgi:hypothetical protein